MMSTTTPRLTVELVPATCWWSNLRTLLPKREWDRIRHDIYAKAGNRCDICGGSGLRWPVECHERWRYDGATHIQYLDGLIALCPRCHQCKHLGHTQIIGLLDVALDHLARVNGWDADTTDAYVSDAFAQWRERSEHKWTLDATTLADQYGIALELPADAA